jgi:hypothetical protein
MHPVFIRVETVIQIRSRESRSTKLTLPIGSPSMLSASTSEVPSRDISSRQSVPKFEIRMSPLPANASPFGSVPSRSRVASLAARPKWSERR